MKHTKLSLSSHRPATSPLALRQRGLSAAAAAVLGKTLGSLALFAMAGAAVADTYTYNPTPVTENWNVTTNWNLSTPPVSGTDTVIVFNPTGGTFPGAVTNANTNNLGTMQLNQLVLQGIGPAADTSPVLITIAGDPLDFNTSTLPAGPVIQLDATNGAGAGSTVTYNVTSAITLSTDTAVQGNGNAGFNFSGVISGPGGLTKSGNSTLTLSGANTYSGLTTITGGTLAYGASNVISGDVYVNGATAVLALGANSDTIANVTLDGGSITGTGTLTATNPFEMRSGTASVVLGGTAGLTKNFAGTVVLSGANTYSGATTINDGFLSISAANGIGDGSLGNTITLNGGVLQTTAGLDLGVNRTVTVNGLGAALQSDVGTLTVSGTVTLNGVSTLTVQGAGNTVISLAIGDGGSGGGLTKAGNGTLTLNSANTYTGTTTISAGTLVYTLSDTIGTGNVTVSGGTLSLGAFSDSVGLVTLSSGNITGTGTLTSTGGFAVSSGTASVNLAGSVGLTKSGAGTVTLSGANTYSGTTAINGGVLQVSTSGNLGDGSATNTITFGGGTLNSTATIALGATRTITLTGSGALQSNTGTTLTVSGAVDLGANQLSVNGTGNVIISSGISGTGGSIAKSSTGALTLSGNNTYTGNTTITGAGATTLNINSATAIGTGALVVNSDATIDNSSGTASLVLTNNNNITLNGGTLNYTGTSGNNLSFGSGVLTVTGGNRVIKPNAGTLTIGSIDADTTARTLEKQGNGNLVITGAAGANFQGGLRMNGAGNVLIGHKNALGTGALVGINSTGALQASTDLSGVNKLPNALLLSGMTVSGTNNIEFGGKLTGNATPTLNSSLVGALLTLNAVDITNDPSATVRNFALQGTGNTTINGVIANGAGAVNHTMSISNSGTTTLNGNNTFTGLLTLNGAVGTVNLNGDNILATGGITLNSPAKLNINTPTALGTGTFTLGGGTFDNTSGTAKVLTTNNTIAWTGTVAFGASAGTGTANNNLTFGTGNINANGSKTLTLNGAQAVVFGGVLRNTIGNNNNITITVNNGTGTTAATSATFAGFVLTTTGTTTARQISINGSGVVNMNGPVTDGQVVGNNLTYSGTGTLVLNSGSSTFTGGFTHNGGTNSIVQIAADSTPTSGIVTSGPVGTGTLFFNANAGSTQAVGGTRTLGNALSFSNVTTTFSGANSFVFNGPVTWGGSNNLAVNNPSTTFNGIFTLRTDASTAQRSLTFTGTGSTIINGAIVNGSTTNGIVAASGTGVVTLAGNNSYTGSLTVSSGSTIKMGHANALGFGGVSTVNGTTTVNAGGTIDLNGQVDVNEQITINGAGVGSAGALVNNSGTPAVIGSGLASVQNNAAGAGYSPNPVVTVSGGGGTGATVAASLGLSVASITTNLNGSTYTVAPTVTISGGGGTAATATVSNAGVITITSAGFGFTSAPTVTITGGTFTGGTGMSATANTTNFVVTGVQVLTAGSGYTSTPTVTIAPGTGGTATVQNITRTSVILGSATTIGGTGDIIINSPVTGGVGNPLTKDGAGKLIFAGTNTYSGPTTITAGTLQVGNGGTTGTLGTAAITNNAALAFNRTDSITVSNVVSGTGTLTQQGAGGTTILTGANTYSGITTISNGTLQIGSGGTAGALGTGNVTNNAALVFNRSNSYTVANAISGTGSVTKQGTGTTILTGANSYGTTTISAGVLQIGDGGTTGSLGSGAVTDNASLVFNRSDTQTITNAISGTGSVTNSGGAANVLNLNGVQSYATLNANSGTTNVNSSFTAPATVNVNGTAMLHFSTSQNLTALNIGTGPFQEESSLSDFGGPTTAAVPEPGTMGLLVVGVLGMLARRRRKA